MAKILVSTITIIFFSSFYSLAGDDFIISLQNDTLKGEISYFDDNEIRFTDQNGRIHNLEPFEIKGARYNDTLYTTCNISEFKFCELYLDDFPISLVKKKRIDKKTIIIDGYSDPGYNSTVFYDYYLWNRKTDKYKFISEFRFKKQTQKYFKSCQNLTNEIRNNDLNFDSLRYIVKKYNRCTQK